MAGAKTTITRIGSIRWKASQEFLPVLEALFPPGAGPDAVQDGAKVLKSGPRRTVYSLTHSHFEGPILVKRYRPGTSVERLREFLGISLGEREFNASERLANLGVAVPEALAFGRSSRNGIPNGSIFLSRYVEDASSVLDILTGGGGDPDLWEALGRFLADLHRADFTHPDLHLGNVLARPGKEGWSLFLVDLHSIPPFATWTPRRIETNLAQVRNSFVAGKARDFLRGLRAYLRNGPPPGVEAKGLARRVRDRADELLEAFYRRRTLRCLKNSSAFVAGRSGHLRFFRRREVPEADLLGAVAAAREGACGPVLKDGENTRLVAGVPLGDRAVIVKEYVSLGMGAHLGALFGASRGREAWLGGNGLLARGVDAPRPLGFVEDRIAWVPRRSYVVLEDLRALPQLDKLVAWSMKEGSSLNGRQVAGALGRFVGEMHGKGIYHADLKACNFLVDLAKGTARRFFLLDHDRLVFGRDVPSRRRRKNLMQLNTSVPRRVSKGLRARFLKAYLKALPYPGGFKTLWRGVLEAGRGREVVYVTDEGDVIEEGF